MQHEINIIKGLATVLSLLFENKKQTVTKENIIEIFNNTFDINLAQADISKPAHVPSVILESDASIEIQITHHSDDSDNSSQVNHISKNKKWKKNRSSSGDSNSDGQSKSKPSKVPQKQSKKQK